MTAVPLTVVGTLTGKDGSENVTLVGMATITGLEVGGGPGPGYPAHPIAPGGRPPSVWPSPGHPAHPIVIPPTIWPDPPEGQGPTVEHPIVLPHPPQIQGPDLQVKIVWSEEDGWAIILVPAGTTPAPSSGRRG